MLRNFIKCTICMENIRESIYQTKYTFEIHCTSNHKTVTFTEFQNSIYKHQKSFPKFSAQRFYGLKLKTKLLKN